MRFPTEERSKSGIKKKQPFQAGRTSGKSGNSYSTQASHILRHGFGYMTWTVGLENPLTISTITRGLSRGDCVVLCGVMWTSWAGQVSDLYARRGRQCQVWFPRKSVACGIEEATSRCCVSITRTWGRREYEKQTQENTPMCSV